MKNNCGKKSGIREPGIHFHTSSKGTIISVHLLRSFLSEQSIVMSHEKTISSSRYTACFCQQELSCFSTFSVLENVFFPLCQYCCTWHALLGIAHVTTMLAWKDNSLQSKNKCIFFMLYSYCYTNPDELILYNCTNGPCPNTSIHQLVKIEKGNVILISQTENWESKQMHSEVNT